MDPLTTFATLFIVAGIVLLVQSKTLFRVPLHASQPMPAELLVRFKTARDGIMLAMVGASLDCAHDVLAGNALKCGIRLAIMALLYWMLMQWNERIRKIENMMHF